jgi:hypothetical protein
LRYDGRADRPARLASSPGTAAKGPPPGGTVATILMENLDNLMKSNIVSHTGVMAARHTPWAPPLVEMATGMVGHLLAWERHERDGSWWAWVSWVQESGGRHHHKVVQVRADSLRPLEAPEAYKAVPRQLRRLDGQIRRIG